MNLDLTCPELLSKPTAKNMPKTWELNSQKKKKNIIRVMSVLKEEEMAKRIDFT